MQSILIVDDSSMTLRLYERILATLPGVKCVAHTSSLAALAQAQACVPDLVVVDYEMPEMNGLEFIERFREAEEHADVPVVMITAAEDRKVRHRALDVGADDFLLKPVDHIELTARAKNLLSLRESRLIVADRAMLLAQEVKQATSLIEEREKETIYRLTRTAEFKDEDTANHIVRIGHFAGFLAGRLGFSVADQELLRLAAPMHDIGKVAIPDEILLKPGPLNPDEWAIMKTHAQAGHDILCDSPSPMLRKGAEIALTHHERFDGTGYPWGLAGDTIPISGRITSLCDVFDALLSARPYKAPWPLAQVIAYIELEAGKQFDPAVVRAFKSSISEFEAIRTRFDDRLAIV